VSDLSRQRIAGNQSNQSRYVVVKNVFVPLSALYLSSCFLLPFPFQMFLRVIRARVAIFTNSHWPAIASATMQLSVRTDSLLFDQFAKCLSCLFSNAQTWPMSFRAAVVVVWAPLSLNPNPMVPLNPFLACFSARDCDFEYLLQVLPSVRL
jgi:hypothetical protein